MSPLEAIFTPLRRLCHHFGWQGAALRAAREETGASVERVAEVLGVSAMEVRDWESGRRVSPERWGEVDRLIDRLRCAGALRALDVDACSIWSERLGTVLTPRDAGVERWTTASGVHTTRCGVCNRVARLLRTLPSAEARRSDLRDFLRAAGWMALVAVGACAVRRPWLAPAALASVGAGLAAGAAVRAAWNVAPEGRGATLRAATSWTTAVFLPLLGPALLLPSAEPVSERLLAVVLGAPLLAGLVALVGHQLRIFESAAEIAAEEWD